MNPALKEAPTTSATENKPSTTPGAAENGKRSKTRLRELAADVDKLQDRQADLEEEIKTWNADAAKRRVDLKKQIAATIKAWNDEAAKRK